MPNLKYGIAFITLSGLFAVLAVGCAAANPQAVATPTATVESTPSAASTVPSLPTAESESPTETAQRPVVSGPASITFTEETTARYRVREQLARLDFPNDAVGETTDVTGEITLDSNGQVVGEESKIVVDLQTLASDESRRDNFLRTRSLETDTYPSAEFAIRDISGLQWPLPHQGSHTFQIAGDMTLHGETRPLAWDVDAEFDQGAVVGVATTDFTFEEFGIAIPRLQFLISVDNNIRLELDFSGSIS